MPKLREEIPNLGYRKLCAILRTRGVAASRAVGGAGAASQAARGHRRERLSQRAKAFSVANRKNLDNLTSGEIVCRLFDN
jgi:hypothetical protein